MLLWDTRRDRVRSERASGHSVRRWVLRSAPRGPRPANPARRRRRRRARPFRRVGRRVFRRRSRRGVRLVLAGLAGGARRRHDGRRDRRARGGALRRDAAGGPAPPGDLGAHAPHFFRGAGMRPRSRRDPAVPGLLRHGALRAGGGGSGGQARHGLPRMPDSRVHHRDGRWDLPGLRARRASGLLGGRARLPVHLARRVGGDVFLLAAVRSVVDHARRGGEAE